MLKKCENCGFNHRVNSKPFKACQKLIKSKKTTKKPIKKVDWLDKPENKIKIYVGIGIGVLAVIVMVVNRI